MICFFWIEICFWRNYIGYWTFCHTKVITLKGQYRKRKCWHCVATRLKWQFHRIAGNDSVGVLREGGPSFKSVWENYVVVTRKLKMNFCVTFAFKLIIVFTTSDKTFYFFLKTIFTLTRVYDYSKFWLCNVTEKLFQHFKNLEQKLCFILCEV